jgi:signal transduction histidine kinase
LLLRHRIALAPLAGPLAIAAAARLDSGWTPTFALFFSVVLAGWSMGSSASKSRQLVVRTAGLVAIVVATSFAYSRRPLVDSAYVSLFGLTALFFGWVAGRRAAQVDKQRQELDAAEAARTEYVRGVAAYESARIAVELHDVVGHSVGLMTLQAGAARIKLQAGSTEAAREALLAVETVGHAALVDLRRMLGVLRRDTTPAPRS